MTPAPSAPRHEELDSTIVALLGAVREAGPTIDVDNALLVRRLGWSPGVVAERVAEARQRLLLWGIRIGGRPGPCYESIELTVQGRRLLKEADRAGRPT